MSEPHALHLQLANFSGPLDLLLQLIEAQQLDITEVSLAQVVDQYIAAVDALHEPPPDVLAEFLVIGAKLLVIKTRALLPQPPAELAVEEEDVGEGLAQQLKLYQQFKQAAGQLRAWEAEGRRAFGRLAAPPLPPPSPPPALDVALSELVAALQRRLQLLADANETVTMPVAKVVTIADVTRHVHLLLRHQQWISFEDLLSLSLTRNELIVTLWTVLELFKRQAIVLEQPELFGAIMLGKGPAFDALETVEEVAFDGLS